MAKSDHSLMVKLVGQIDKSYQETVNQIKKDSTAFERRNKMMMDGAKKWTRNVTLPIAAAVGYGVKEVISLERGLAQISTIADTSKVSIEDLSNGIKNLSMKTGKDLADVTDAVYESISSGIKTEDSLAFVEKATKLAVGGNTELSTSVDVLTNIINGYGTSIKDVDHYMDVMFKTQDKGKIKIDELASNIGSIISTANMAGTSIDQLGAMLSIMTVNGIDAAESTTAINSLMVSMTKSGSKADKALKDIAGKGFTQLQKEGKSVVDILAMLNTYATGKGMNMANIFDQRALKAANTLIKGGAEEYNNLVKEMENSQGTADKAYDLNKDTFYNDLMETVQTMKVVAMEFGETVMPVLKEVLEGVRDLSSGFNDLPSGAKNAIIVITLTAAALGPLAQGILKTREAFLILKGLGMVAKFGKIKGAVSLAGGAMKLAGANAGGLLTAFAGLSASMLAAGGIVAVIGLFVAGMMQVTAQMAAAERATASANKQLDAFWKQRGVTRAADVGIPQNKGVVGNTVDAFKETYNVKNLLGVGGRAQGGIIKRPEVSWIGEDGPEAIVPLSKPRRGREVLAQAASILGATESPRQSAVYNNSYTINIASTDPKAVAQEVKRTLLEIEREQRRRVLA